MVYNLKMVECEVLGMVCTVYSVTVYVYVSVYVEDWWQVGGSVVHYIGVVTPDTLYCEDWQWRMSTGTQTCHYQITKTENNKNTAICRAEFISKQDPNLNDRNERYKVW